MIVDITNELLTDLKYGLPKNITILSGYQSTTASFPTIIVEELDNSDDILTKDSSGVKYNNISFGIEIYTIGNKRMSQAKSIRNKINKIISDKYGMNRGTPIAVPNYLDENVYRYRLTYSGKINKNKVIYRG